RRGGARGDPGTDGHCDSAEFAVDGLDFAGVHAAPDLQPKRTDRLGDRAGAADGPCRPVEGGEEAVSGRVDLLAAVATQERTYYGVVSLDDVSPRAIADLGRTLG